MIGREIGNYRITSQLGEGGMGLVYLAEHVTIERKVAIKVLRNDLPASTELVTRFVNEARVAATIRHPNVIEVFDTGMLQPEGVPYIVMELLEGESLAERLTRVGRLGIDDALLWSYEIAAALGVAHAKGIIHRDLKPGNLYLVADDRQPDREKIKVLDFGIAKLRGSLAAFGSHTQTGSIMGTPIYMSPEQCRGIKEIDSRSDIYSLGIILYEMLCGEPPFVSPGFGELLSMHLMKAPAPPRSHNPLITERLERVILTALAKLPEERFETVGEFQAALGFEPSRVGPTASAMSAVTPVRGGDSGRASAPAPTVASAVTNPPTPALAPTQAPPGTPPSIAPSPMSATPTSGRAATPSSARGTRPSGATQVSSASIILTPASGIPSVAGTPGAGGAPPTKRLRPPVLIAAGVAAAVAVALALFGGQIGPRFRCTTGKSCTELGDCYDAGRCGIAKDRERACEVYDKDCTAGHTASCVRFGHCFEAHTGGLQASWTRACDLYDKACEAEDVSGCAHLADCLREGVGGRTKQGKQSCDFAQRACNSGDMYGCAALGQCYRAGLGDIGRNDTEACRLFQRSCDGGEQLGCAWLGECHRGNSPDGFARSDEAACQVFKKSCDEGGALSCTHLASCYRDGSGGLARNEAHACELYAEACDDAGLAERAACDGWIACLRQGPGGYPKNPVQAERIEERVCNDGEPRMCAALAASFDDGANGREKDALRACDFHARACGAGGLDCLKAGHCHCQGAVDGAPNPKAAHEAFAKACNAGDKQACDEDKTPGCMPAGAAGLAQAPGVARVPAARAIPPGLANGAALAAAGPHPGAPPPTLTAVQGARGPSGVARPTAGSHGFQMPPNSPPGTAPKPPKSAKGRNDDMYKDIE